MDGNNYRTNSYGGLVILASIGDRIWKVTVTGYVIQKEYMDEPDTWDTLDPVQWDDFVDVPNIEYTELVEPKPLELSLIHI